MPIGCASLKAHKQIIIHNIYNKLYDKLDNLNLCLKEFSELWKLYFNFVQGNLSSHKCVLPYDLTL